VVHEGVNFDTVPPLSQREEQRKRFGIKEDEILLGIVGSLWPGKGFDPLLSAFARLPHHTKLIIIGTDYRDTPGYSEQLKKRIRREGFEDRVIFTGQLDQPLTVMRAFDILGFPTLLAEGFGRTIVEAGALSLPAVASGIGGTNELVLDGKTGYLVPPGDVDLLLNRLQRLIESEAHRREMGQANLEYTRAQFCIHKKTEMLEHLYASLR